MSGSESSDGSRTRGRILRGSFFEISSYGTQQVVRLGSNLITTRLLFPAAFGLSSIVWTITTALVMFSDVALLPCVIQSKRGDDPAFLNTVFTIQAVRGVLLSLFMVLLAKPVAWFYREPMVEPLVYLGSLQLLVGGFHSTSTYTLRRWLRLGWANGFELIQTLVTTAITITLTWYHRSAYTLVLGPVIGGFISTIASHFLPVPYRNRFRWEAEASREIRKFGRWVLGSSAASFLGGQADRIMMGRFLGARWLGIYGVALTISDALATMVGRLISGVMYPVLSEAGREGSGEIAELYYNLRRRLDLLSMGVSGLLAGAGGWFVHTLWDSRYADAAWILQILCVKVSIGALASSAEVGLFSLGHTRYVFQRSLARFLATLVLIPAGWTLGGVRGLIWGAVASEGVTILAVWPKCASLGILRIQRELLAIGIFGVGYALGRMALPWLPALHLR